MAGVREADSLHQRGLADWGTTAYPITGGGCVRAAHCDEDAVGECGWLLRRTRGQSRPAGRAEQQNRNEQHNDAAEEPTSMHGTPP